MLLRESESDNKNEMVSYCHHSQALRWLAKLSIVDTFR